MTKGLDKHFSPHFLSHGASGRIQTLDVRNKRGIFYYSANTAGKKEFPFKIFKLLKELHYIRFAKLLMFIVRSFCKQLNFIALTYKVK